MKRLFFAFLVVTVLTVAGAFAQESRTVRLPNGEIVPAWMIEKLVVNCTVLVNAYNQQERDLILLEGRLALANGQLALLKERLDFKDEQIAEMKRRRKPQTLFGKIARRIREILWRS